MAYPGTVILKYQDQLLPQDLIEKVLKKYPTVCGAAMYDPEEESIDYMTDAQPGTWEWIDQTQTAQKDKEIIFYFGNYPQGFSSEDVQPFVLLEDKEENALLMGFMDGDFSNYKKPNENHSEAYFLKQSLTEGLVELFSDVDNNLDAFYMQLKTPVFRRQMDRVGIGEKTLVFMQANGDLRNFSTRKTDDYAFGWATDSCGYGMEEEKEEKEEEPTARKSKLSFTLRQEPKLAKIIQDSLKKVDVQPAKKGKPPSDCKTKAQKRDWYHEWNTESVPGSDLGRVPEGYSSKAIEVEILDEARSETKRKALMAKTKPAAIAVSNGAKTSDKAATETTKEKEVTHVTTPLIPAGDIDLIQKMLDKQGIQDPKVDANKRVLSFDPKKLQEEEEKYGTVAEQLGQGDVGLDYFNNCPLEFFDEWAETSPKFIARLAWNLRNARLMEIQKRAKEEPPKVALPPGSKLLQKTAS